MLEGRLADPSRIDEATVTPKFVESYGLGIGDTVTGQLYSHAQIQELAIANAPTEPPQGPSVPIRIVGVVRSLWWFADEPDKRGRLFPSPALLRAYPQNLLGDHAEFNGVARLHGGGRPSRRPCCWPSGSPHWSLRLP